MVDESAFDKQPPNPPRLVKWIGDDGGWKLGSIPAIEYRGLYGFIAEIIGGRTAVLVKHSCDGKLELVGVERLQEHPYRSE